MRQGLAITAASIVAFALLVYFFGSWRSVPETGATIADRIQRACAIEYGPDGPDAVLQCRFRHEVAAMDRMRAEREANVRSQAGE